MEKILELVINENKQPNNLRLNDKVRDKSEPKVKRVQNPNVGSKI